MMLIEQLALDWIALGWPCSSLFASAPMLVACDENDYSIILHRN
jgi:hypothetical protein